MKYKFLSLVTVASLLLACSTPNTTTTSTTSTTSTSDNAAYSAPASLQTSFGTQYPDATQVTWSRYDAATVPIDWELTDWSVLDANAHAVSFTMNGDNHYAWYDAQGNWIGTSSSVRDNATLPESIRTMLQTKYTGYTIEKVDREMWKDRTAYEVKMKNGDNKVKVLVDANGNVLKEKMK